jgi:hypothetical protein
MMMMMTTLLIPCAGRSSRFPNMKPKWLLTHPSGALMIEKALEGLTLDAFDRIIITLVKEHDEAYEAALILNQVFAKQPALHTKVELCVLEAFTSSASETVAKTIEAMTITGPLLIKDADNAVCFPLPPLPRNFMVGYNVHQHPHISNLPAKSFLVVNEQGLVQDIIEKRVVSHLICLGVYAFEDAQLFLAGYRTLVRNHVANELFISHVISYLLSAQTCVFEYVEASAYEDWGTLQEWQKVQAAQQTYFVDVDGVLLENCGQYGSTRWENQQTLLKDNVAALVTLQQQGAQVVITTSRPEAYREALQALLKEAGLQPHAMVMGLNHAGRVLVNDFAPTNPYPSAKAISLPRNASLAPYLP